MTLHWGSCSNYERFCSDGSYFVKESAPEDKHYVAEIKYQPDDLYSIMDGMAGRCWIVVIRGKYTPATQTRGASIISTTLRSENHSIPTLSLASRLHPGIAQQCDGVATNAGLEEVKAVEPWDNDPSTNVNTGTYYIRNWVDIVKFFETLGYKFVEKVNSVL